MDFSTRNRLSRVLQAFEAGADVDFVDVDGAPHARTVLNDAVVLRPLQPGDVEAIAAWRSARDALIDETRRLQAFPPPALDADGIAALGEHGIALFEGRFVFEAQPPISEAALARVATRVAGPLPDELVALWRTCFGGRLLYDLNARFEGASEPVALSFTELYYPGSPHYHTLDGWMDHELDLARHAAARRGEPPPDRLAWLPFGGFEYLERLYVRVGGEDHGAVYAWRQALPPSWPDPVGRDGVARLAPGVRALFRALFVDPARVADDLGSANEFLESVVDPLRDDAGDALADRVRALFLAATAP
jgi:hypothetical protein